jgi:hypothetical protein
MHARVGLNGVNSARVNYYYCRALNVNSHLRARWTAGRSQGDRASASALAPRRTGGARAHVTPCMLTLFQGDPKRLLVHPD